MGNNQSTPFQNSKLFWVFAVVGSFLALAGLFALNAGFNLTIIDHNFGTSFFDPSKAKPAFLHHLWWVLGHKEIYAVTLSLAAAHLYLLIHIFKGSRLKRGIFFALFCLVIISVTNNSITFTELYKQGNTTPPSDWLFIGMRMISFLALWGGRLYIIWLIARLFLSFFNKYTSIYEGEDWRRLWLKIARTLFIAFGILIVIGSLIFHLNGKSSLAPSQLITLLFFTAQFLFFYVCYHAFTALSKHTIPESEGRVHASLTTFPIILILLLNSAVPLLTSKTQSIIMFFVIPTVQLALTAFNLLWFAILVFYAAYLLPKHQKNRGKNQAETFSEPVTSLK